MTQSISFKSQTKTAPSSYFLQAVLSVVNIAVSNDLLFSI